MQSRPTLLNGCAAASSAAEARFRIDKPVRLLRSTRVIGLEPDAESLVRAVAAQARDASMFFSCENRPPSANGSGRANGSGPPVASEDAAVLVDMGRSRHSLDEVLAGADLVVMVATTDDATPAASMVGKACSLHGIMTAALVIGQIDDLGATLSALRPYARMLMVSRDGRDLSEILAALRA